LVYEGGRRSSLCSTKLNCICDTFFPVTFKIEKLESQMQKQPIRLIEWFFAESGFELLDDATDEEYERMGSIVPLEILVKKYQPQLEKRKINFS
jgi:magnesium chelatase subunit I